MLRSLAEEVKVEVLPLGLGLGTILTWLGLVGFGGLGWKSQLFYAREKNSMVFFAQL